MAAASRVERCAFLKQSCATTSASSTLRSGRRSIGCSCTYVLPDGQHVGDRIDRVLGAVADAIVIPACI